MRHYLEAPYASMEMRFDPLQHTLLVDTINKYNIDICIETGTYLGLGSTTNLAKAFIESNVNTAKIFTFEANHENFYKARDNLSKYPFVVPLMGSSLSKEDIEEFITNDDALLHPEKYPNVYSDYKQGEDARPGYISESIGAGSVKPPEWNDFPLLTNYLGTYSEVNPLIVLDSAGGLGWAEYQVMMEILQHSPFVLLLDDVEHVKHFRSLDAIKNDPNFELLATRNGWALAIHNGD